MRILPAFLALVVLAASAGCMGGDESSNAPSPTPTAEPTPPVGDAPSPTPAATPPAEPATPAPAPSPTPSVPAAEPAPATPAKELYNATFDFASQGDPTGQSPKSFQSQPALAGHATVFVNVTLTRASTTPTMVPVSGTLNSPTVRILDPNGGEAAAVTTEGATSIQVPALPGAWTVRYEGAGTLRATVSLVAVA